MTTLDYKEGSLICVGEEFFEYLGVFNGRYEYAPLNPKISGVREIFCNGAVKKSFPLFTKIHASIYLDAIKVKSIIICLGVSSNIDFTFYSYGITDEIIKDFFKNEILYFTSYSPGSIIRFKRDDEYTNYVYLGCLKDSTELFFPLCKHHYCAYSNWECEELNIPFGSIPFGYKVASVTIKSGDEMRGIIKNFEKLKTELQQTVFLETVNLPLEIIPVINYFLENEGEE